MTTILPSQCRAARALLDMRQAQLAELAGVGLSTLQAFEAGTRMPIANNLRAIQQTLEDGGVEFLNHGQPGVRMRNNKG